MDDCKPKLALDMYVLAQGIKTGVYRVCDELFPRLARSNRLDVRLFYRAGNEPKVAAWIESHDIPLRCRKPVWRGGPASADALLSPFGVAPANWLMEPSVLKAHFIYDLIAIRHPEYFPEVAATEVKNIIDSLDEDTIVFAISEFTKKDLLAYRPDLSPHQITVVPLAAGPLFRPCDAAEQRKAVRAKYAIPPEAPYVLSLATLEIRKNFDLVVNAFVLFLEQNPASQMHLVLSGMSGWKLEQLQAALSAHQKWRHRIVLTGFVDDADLAALYSDARCFIYMSRYEGFGLPPLEAMACGTPVICADNSSLPEVVGNAGVLLNADDVAGVAEAIHRLDVSETWRTELSRAGLQRASLFSWDRCAEIVIETLCTAHRQHVSEQLFNRRPPMARIAYVDHSYHRTTRSTHFLRDILRRRGHDVDDFWDDAWKGGAAVAWLAVQDYDVVIMFQSYCAPEGAAFRQVHPNVVYIPMLDQFAIWKGPMTNQAHFWSVFQGSKVLNFSSALHCLTTGFGIASYLARYYPPAQPPQERAVEGLRGFFWMRHQDQINWQLISQLIEGSSFDSFHIHLAPDPGSPQPQLPSAEDVRRYNITTSTWFEDPGEMMALIDKANVYFAPRMAEGIGQSFLEAMSRGKCVVAPNQGTMNEYIVHGLNGLLYEHHAPRPLDFSDVARLGAQARASVVAGHAQWLAAEDGIVDFILAPSQELYVGKYQHAFPVAGHAAPAPTPTPAPAATGGGGGGSLVSSLRAISRRYTVFKVTRPLWHPGFRLARALRRSLRRI